MNLEAKSPIINGLMVEIPMFCLCDVRALKLALTACLSGLQLSSSPWEKASSACVTVSVRAWLWKKLAHRGKISDFYGENMLWKKGARQEHLHVHMHNRESIRYKLTSLAAAYFYWIHFLWEIAPTVSLILQLNQSERRNTLQTIARFVLWYSYKAKHHRLTTRFHCSTQRKITHMTPRILHHKAVTSFKCTKMGLLNETLVFHLVLLTMV